MGTSEASELFYELESGGYKLTKLRQTVIDIFTESQSPLLLEELGKRLKAKSMVIHRTTLYRELVFLEKKQIIESVPLDDGKPRYEFARGHHHHAVCVKCKKIEDVELKDDSQLEKLVQTKNDFEITRHTLEFFGVCGACK